MIFADSILLLVVLVYGLLVMFGLAKASNFFRIILILLFGPLLLLVAVTQLATVLGTLPAAPKIVLILVSPLILMVLLYYLFPKASWSKQLQNAIYNGYKAVLITPFRWLASVVRWVIRRIRGTP